MHHCGKSHSHWVHYRKTELHQQNQKDIMYYNAAIEEPSNGYRQCVQKIWFLRYPCKQTDSQYSTPQPGQSNNWKQCYLSLLLRHSASDRASVSLYTHNSINGILRHRPVAKGGVPPPPSPLNPSATRSKNWAFYGLFCGLQICQKCIAPDSTGGAYDATPIPLSRLGDTSPNAPPPSILMPLALRSLCLSSPPCGSLVPPLI